MLRASATHPIEVFETGAHTRIYGASRGLCGFGVNLLVSPTMHSGGKSYFAADYAFHFWCNSGWVFVTQKCRDAQ